MPTNDDEMEGGAEVIDFSAFVKSKDPIDLFGNALMTGRPRLTRDMVPAVLWDYADDVAERIGLNPASIVLPMLCAVGTAIRDGWRIQPKLNDPFWKESPILWVGITGNTGAAKSSAIKAALKPLKTIEEEWRKQDARDLAEWEQEKPIHVAMQKAYQKFMSGEWPVKKEQPQKPGDAPEKPAVRRLIANDLTAESAILIAQDNPDGYAVVSDELSGWIGSFDAYSASGAAKDQAFYLSAFNGDEGRVDRVSKTVYAERVAISIIGGIQDDTLAKIMGDMPRDGFTARFLFATAEPRRGKDIAPNMAANEAYAKLLTDIVALTATDKDIVKLGEDAQAYRIELHEFRHAANMIPTIPQGLRDHLQKWDSLFARLCLILHFIECVGTGERPSSRLVSGDTARQVRDLLTDFFLPEAGRIFGEVLATDEETNHARWIAGHVLAHKLPRITLYEIQRANHAAKKDMRGIRQAMEILELMSWVKPKDRSQGRDVRVWLVNPRAHVVFAEKAAAEAARRAEVRNQIAASVAELQARRAMPALPPEQAASVA